MPALTPAAELAARNAASFPNESAEYREARNALLAEEIELRRHVERVAEMRRALPAGGEVPKDYAFEGESGTVTLSGLFGGKDTLFVYSYMFGPQREKPCAMCTSFLDALASKVGNIADRVAFAVTARSPIARLVEWKKTHGWTDMPLYSDASGEFTRAYVSAEDDDVPGMTVFTRRDSRFRHFWSGEIGGDMADPGQDPRGHLDPDPLWHLLDLTPEGRDPQWYPKLLNG